jgi:uncharacterized membrane protein (UPF0127 family)
MFALTVLSLARRAILFGALALLLQTGLASPATVEPLEIVTRSGVHVFDVELAVTPDERSKGLMFRRELPPGRGMLFDFEGEGPVAMWMRNTYVSLDMVFIRADGVVHRIEAHTEPLSERIIASQGPVTAVLELAAGEAERLKLRPGDRVLHPAFKNGAGKATGATGK